MPQTNPESEVASLITVDYIEPVKVPRDTYCNELSTLTVLTHGILALVNSIDNLERQHEPSDRNRIGFEFDPTSSQTHLVTCMFHWFATSVCNYARMIGFIRGIEHKDFTRVDLRDRNGCKWISKKISAYLDAIPELQAVRSYRNKVAAHLAITDPRHDDNPATLALSAMPHIAKINGKYTAGAITLGMRNSTGYHQSQMPPWSLTEAFISLRPRFWLNVTRATAESSQVACSAEDVEAK